MINKSKQVWAVGSTVKVGFMSSLLVVAAVATPGDFKPDAYILSRGDKFYSFVPHNGLVAIDADEAREMIADAKRTAELATAKAIAQAKQSAAHAALVADLMVA